MYILHQIYSMNTGCPYMRLRNIGQVWVVLLGTFKLKFQSEFIGKQPYVPSHINDKFKSINDT